MKLFSVILTVLLTGLTFSQTPEYTRLLNKGISEAYNFKFTEAEKTFEQLIDTSPNLPHSYLQLAKIHLWFYMGSGDEGEFGIVKRYCELGIDKAEKILDEKPDDPEILTILGELNSQIAIGSAVNRDTFEAFLKTKSAIGYFEDSIDEGGEYSNNYLWLGVFKYSISFVPGFLKFAISITGLSGDKKEGLDLIRRAALSDSSNAEAYFHYARVLTEFNAEYDTAEVYLENLMKRFPDNLLFKYQLVILRFKQRRLQSAEELINQILAKENEKFSQTNAFCRLLLGDIYYRRNKFSEAVRHYSNFIRYTNTLDYTGIANYRMAICYGMLGKNDLYKKNLELAKQGNEDLPDDELASKMVDYLRRDGFSNSFKLIIFAENNIHNAEYKAVEDSLVDKVSQFRDEEKEGFADYLLAESFLHSGKRDSSMKYAHLAAGKEYKNFPWVKAAAFLILAKSEFSIGHIEEAEEYINEAENDANEDTRGGIVKLRNQLLTNYK